MRRRQGFLALFAGDTGEIKAEIREQVRAPRTRTIRGCISAALNSCASVDLCRRGARRGWVGAEDTGRADAARDELDAQAVSHLARRQSASTKRPSRAPPSVSPPPLSRTAPSSSPRALASASRVFDLPGGRRRGCSSGRGGGGGADRHPGVGVARGGQGGDRAGRALHRRGAPPPLRISPDPTPHMPYPEQEEEGVWSERRPTVFRRD